MTNFRQPMSRFLNLISYSDAIGRIKGRDWKQIDDEIITVSSSLGRIASENVAAKMPLPTRERSLVDGFAIRSSDAIGAQRESPVTFRIVGRKEAGSGVNFRISKGQCVEIYTGAAMPEGSDAVVMAEDSIQDSGTISITGEVSTGTNVSKVGQDISRNYPILQKGDRIKPMHIAAMLSSGTLHVWVKKTIICGVFSTGNELFNFSQDHLYNSAEPAIKAFFESQYIKIRMLGKCRDSEEDIEQKVSRWINTMDAMIITGGTSLGRYDLVPESLSKMAGQVFGGVRTRPGRTAALYSISGKPVFSVSGFPSSAIISLWLFLPGYLHSVTGLNVFDRVRMMPLASELHSKAGYTSVVPVKITRKGDGEGVVPVSHGSIRMVDLLEADGLVLVPDSVEGYSGESHVEVHEVSRF